MKKGYGNNKPDKSIKKAYIGEALAEYKPTFSLTPKELPEIADWEVGKTYKLEMTVKQVGMHQHESPENKSLSCTFEIEKVSVDDDDTEDSEDDD